MKVKEFIQKLNDIGYNDDTEIVFDFKDIEKGDIFRMFKSTGEPVLGDKNDTMFEAISDAYISEDGEYQVEIK